MKNRVKSWVNKNLYYILAFLVPLSVAVVAFICQGIWPFGDRGVSIIDSYHQYVPFFSELQYKWRHFDSLFYSWNGGLGMNFWAVIAYYLASPLNLLLLIFPKSMVMECFALIYFIKIGLCGLSFACFVHRRFNARGFSMTVFGCCYALSSFVIGYGWNIMWLDCIVLFPMVMLGLHQLVSKGRGWLYGISLAVCIYTNYYISIMICIFACLDLVIEVSCARKVCPGKLVKRMLGFAGYSLLAGGFGAVMLVPAAYTLMGSQSAKTSFPTTVKFYQDVFELLCQHFAFAEPTNLSGNFNLYCGAVLMLLVPMYVFNRRIKLRERCIKFGMTVFLLVCLNTNVLTYIWHGFHFPNGLPGRYSFIYIFMLLSMGYEGCKKRRYCSKWVPVLSMAGWLAILVFCWMSGRVSLEIYTWVVNLVLLLVYGGVLTLILIWKKKRRILEFILLVAVFVEAVGYGIFGLCMNGTVNRQDYYSDQKDVLEIKSRIEADEGENFYRIELEERRGRDDVTWHNVPGMSLFSSTVNAGVDNIMKRLGFYAVTNKYSYEGATPETDAIFNIKYLISREKLDGIRTFEWIDETEKRNVYRNPYALGLGFMVPDTIMDWDYEMTNPFKVINELVYSVTDLEDEAFTCFGLPEPTAEGCELTTDTWADWTYLSGDGKDGGITYTYTSDKEKDMYVYFKATHCECVKLIRGDQTDSYSDEDGHIIHIGNVAAGETISLEFKLDDSYEKGTIKLIGAEHSDEVFEQFFEQLRDEQWVTDEATSNRLHGTITAKEDGWMFTSIPYENGWTVKVDGKTVRTEAIANAFIGIYLPSGSHEIEMTYMPEGFAAGLGLTCVSSVLLAAAYFAEKNRGK